MFEFISGRFGNSPSQYSCYTGKEDDNLKYILNKIIEIS